ncbi:MAG TPA: GyrI-like domain-containing protein [Armatimonadota bacterium]|jgi:AraC family transcriptional regulator
MAQLQPRIEQRAGFLVVGMAETGRPADIDFGALWGRFSPRIHEAPDPCGADYYGVCREFRSDGAYQYVAGIQVGSLDAIPAGMIGFEVPAATYAVFEVEGLEEIGKTWRAVYEEWLPSSGYQCSDAPCFELYPSDFDPAAGRAGVKLFQPLR